MIYKGILNKNLKYLDKMYNQTRSNYYKIFYSKLAVLELCGWIETTIDEMFSNISNGKLNSVNIKYLETKIRKTYGFSYDRHIRDLLIIYIGLKKVEIVENRMDVSIFINLKNSLERLKQFRDDFAHTYTNSMGGTRIYVSPSVVMNEFINVYNGLKELNKNIKRY